VLLKKIFCCFTKFLDKLINSQETYKDIPPKTIQLYYVTLQKEQIERNSSR